MRPRSARSESVGHAIGSAIVVESMARRLGDLADALGRDPAAVRFARAPGRVNLIGEHTDYQDGFCLPVAIDREVVVGWRPRPDEVISIRSLDFDATATFIPTDDPTAIDPEWARPAIGMARVLAEAGRDPIGIDAVVGSTVPIGAGLSSSAAFEVATGVALAAVAEFEIAGTDLALAAQRAEHIASGVPCGVMDQMASVHGRAGHALLLDCRTLAIAPVAIPAELAIVVVHCGVPRTLADSEYAERRAAVEAVALRLGVSALRDASPEDVKDHPFARHVVSENRRTLMFVAALRRGRFAELGEHMLASHASLRDDFCVSTPALDALVTALMDSGAIGARLTGAGFGGCVVALCPAADAERIAGTAAERYRARTGNTPESFVVHSADGAGILAPES